MVPVSGPGLSGGGVLQEAMLKIVENGELVPGHDIRVGRRLDLVPNGGDGSLQDLADGDVLCTIGTLAGDFEGLHD